MKITTQLALLLSLIGFGFTPSAHATHIGAFYGTSFFNSNLSPSHSSSSYGTVAFDAAMSLAPNAEIGVFYQRASSVDQTLLGGEFFFYPMITKTFYAEAKLGNADHGGNNFLVYAPGIGFNFDILPLVLTFGVDATYYLYSSGGGNDLALLGNFKFWF